MSRFCWERSYQRMHTTFLVQRDGLIWALITTSLHIKTQSHLPISPCQRCRLDVLGSTPGECDILADCRQADVSNLWNSTRLKHTTTSYFLWVFFSAECSEPTSLSAQSWQYRDKRKPEAGTVSSSYQLTSMVLYSAQYHMRHCALQAFEKFGALYLHNLDNKHPIQPGFEPNPARIWTQYLWVSSHNPPNEPSGPTSFYITIYHNIYLSQWNHWTECENKMASVGQSHRCITFVQCWTSFAGRWTVQRCTLNVVQIVCKCFVFAGRVRYLDWGR